jgi:magnesium transporter
MDRIGERVEDLGEDVFVGRQVQNDVFALRRDLVTIRRVMGPMGDANLTVVSNKVNEVARTLTAYAAIFAALTLVSGVYGMNFEHMPELRWRLGYPYAVGLMLALAAGLWGFFKRKG